MGTHTEDHMFHILLARNLSFPSLIITTSHIKPTNDGAILMQLPRPLKIQSYTPNNILEICCVMACFNLTLISTIFSSSVVIDIHSCCVIIMYHLILLTTFSTLRTCEPAWLPSYNLHNQVACKQEENKASKLYNCPVL